MSDALYVTSMQARSGKAVVALGLMEHARRPGRSGRGVPAGDRRRCRTRSADRALTRALPTRVAYEDTYAFTYSDAARVEDEGGPSRLIAQVLDRVRAPA